MKKFLRKGLTPGRIIALGFASVILFGAIMLLLPISQNENVNLSFIDALFTSTSAVCVTGLVTVDTAETFSVFGRTILALLIQIGGLGVTSIGVGIIILSGRKIGLRERTLAKEGLNYASVKGILALVKSVLLVTLTFETVGMILSFIVFAKDYGLVKGLGISAFHSVAAFNNSGFDILGGMKNLADYKNNAFLNLVTCGLIIFGGLGFFTIQEIIHKHSFKKFSLHSKIVIFTTGFLLISGTILLKLTENITWLGAFFNSTSARTAGFSTFPLANFSNAGLLTLCILMFIGASPGSTGGGIKTTTFFVLLKSLFSVSTNKSCTAFKRQIPKDILYKAFSVTSLALMVVLCSTFALTISEPDTDFMKLLFEVISGFGTVGLSTGITPELAVFSKSVLVLTMFIGRLGPLTVATLWMFKRPSGISFAEEPVNIG
ncbi:MAG: potassium transporter TrkG [Oscillospiraceae bacterium]